MSSGDEFGSELYDLARGPRRPATRRRVSGEWDDPTWISVEVTEEFEVALEVDGDRWASTSRWVTSLEAAWILGVDRRSLHAALSSGLLPVRAARRRHSWRVLRKDVERLARDRRR